MSALVILGKCERYSPLKHHLEISSDDICEGPTTPGQNSSGLQGGSGPEREGILAVLFVFLKTI